MTSAVLVLALIGFVPADPESVPVAVPAPSPLAVRYHETGQWLWLVGQAWTLAIPAGLLFTGVSARLRDIARAIAPRAALISPAFALLYLPLLYLLRFPLAFYSGYVRQHAYGLSRQGFGRWLGDSLLALGVNILLWALLIGVPYWLMRRSPGRWWFWAWGLTVPLAFALMLVKPIWYDPLFNDFRPLRDPALEAKIQDLARRAGISGGRIFEVDKGRDTATVNAYVVGLLGTKRIVLWDTLLTKLDEGQVLFVLGHEMGHYVLGHVVRSLLLSSILVLIGLYLAHRLAGPIVARFRSRFGFDRPDDIASVPLFLLLFQVFALIALPAVTAYSRLQEREADRFALELTRANHTGATSFVRLQQENLGVPRHGWAYRLWRATHPSLGERIDFCNAYHPWREGRPLAYDHLIAGGRAPAGGRTGL